ncbi:hypothetical protein [Leadbettera azotonutricia]|uniref:hypothetical protein n=1 Tax=Leadbettera azotonutricia TaxID=150829 RepID=UPI001FE1187B|nr:hypothetical protein [Leadbettera azotonutricia]
MKNIIYSIQYIKECCKPLPRQALKKKIDQIAVHGDKSAEQHLEEKRALVVVGIVLAGVVSVDKEKDKP